MSLQPLHRFSVEVVGGLVKEQDVGFGEQQTAQGHATALATGEVFHGRVAVGTAQGVHGALQLVVQLPSIVLVDEFGELALPLDEFVHLVVAHRFGEFHVHLLIFFQNIHNLLHALLHHLLHGEVVVQLRLLRQIANGVARREDHLALVRLVDAGDDFQQRGFARAVETQHADFRPIKEGEIDVLKDMSLRWNRLADVDHRENNLLVVCHRFAIYN